MVPLSLPPIRLTDASPGEPLPRPMKFGGVVFGLTASEEQAAAANNAVMAAARIEAEIGLGRMALACFMLTA
jgi:hypothetical protein